MKASGAGAGRYVWCRSQAVWLNLALVARLEDLEGAISAGQPGLVRYSAMAIGEDCAVILALTTHKEKPLPTRRMRGAWAFERIADHELRPQCWELVRSFASDASDTEIRDACLKLVAAVREVVGQVPNGLSHDGYFPMLALTREWYQLLEKLDQTGFFPEEWTRRATPPPEAA